MGRKIRLTESEFHSLIKRIIIETQNEMGMESDDHEMDNESDYSKMDKSEVVNTIADFFKKKLRRLDDEQIEDLEDVVSNQEVEGLTEMFLREDISDRMKSFKEKAMMRGGLGMVGAGALGMISQAMGYTDAGELMTKIHDIVQLMGGGPVSTAMVFAGLLLALKGRVDRDTRLGK